MRRYGTICHLVLFLFVTSAVMHSTTISINTMGAATASHASGSTWYVGGVGPNNYTLIQRAIDNASEGDTVFVYDGIYHESIEISSHLRLIGESTEATIISGDNHEYTLLLTGVNTRVTGFTLKGETDASGIKITGGHNIATYCDIRGMSYGIYFRHSSFNIVTNCSFNDNGYYGVFMVECPNCGHVSHKNTLYHNNFIVPHGKAFADSFNMWDNGKEGNYWVDYTGNDEDGDGIGDDPYHVPGGGGQDRYPLMNPVDHTPPAVTIIFPNGGEIVSGNITIKWSVTDNSDAHPICEIEYSDDAGITWRTLATRISGSEYTWDTTHLVPGEQYLLQISATDSAGNIGKDTVDGEFTIIRPPSVTIIKPSEGYLYVLDRAILPVLKTTVIIGKINVETAVSSVVGVDAVNFYINGNFKEEVGNSPYVWLWDEKGIGKRTIKAVAIDTIGGIGSDKQETWIFNV